MKNHVEKILKVAQSKKDGIEMLLSAFADFGSSDGCLLSVRRFSSVADMIIEFVDKYDGATQPSDEPGLKVGGQYGIICCQESGRGILQ